MKNHTKRIPAFFGVLLTGLLLATGSCINTISPPEKPEGLSPEKGRLAITVDGYARATALPEGAFDYYKLRFQYTGSEGYTHEDTIFETGLAVDLEPGDWTIHVEAYKNGALSGIGNKDVTINAGGNNAVTLRITTMNTGEGSLNGMLKLRVTYPGNDSEHDYVLAEGTALLPAKYLDNPTANLDPAAILEITQLQNQLMPIENGVEKAVYLKPGVYVVSIAVGDDIQHTRAFKIETAHIYGGMETSQVIDFAPEEFTTLIPVTGTADFTVSGGGAVSARVVRAYADAGCTEAILEVAAFTPSGDDSYTLMIPSRYKTVYVRQELTIGGQPVSGGPMEVDLEQLFDGSGAVALDAVLRDVFYKINVEPADHGSLSASQSYAVENTPITLTATPEAGYALKSAEIVYDGEASPVGGPPYAFDMPGADVTVIAKFAEYTVRYVRADGTGDGTSWDNASDDLQKMMDELAANAVAAPDAGPFVVKVGYGTYKPRYAPGPDGTSLSEAEFNTVSPALTSRDKTFILRAGVRVWGGYIASGNPADTDRNTEDYRAVLSGDFDDDDTVSGSGSTLSITGNGENAYHVVLGVNIPADGKTVLDGFTITGGNANGTGDIVVNSMGVFQCDGGGMYNSYSPVLTNNVTISGNSAIGAGGGMLNLNSSPVLTNVTILANSASYGGGIVNSFNSSPVLTDVTISGNSGIGYGGGINNNNSSPVLTNVAISGNTAGNGGGGMYNAGNSSPVLTNVIISGNTVNGDGGGMYNVTNSSPVLTNVAISGNTAGNGGGGMFNSDNSTPVLTNVTISGNSTTSPGSGIFNYSNSSPLIRNSIIWGNTASSEPDIYNYDSGSAATITYSIVQGSGSGSFWITDGTPGQNIDGGNNLDVNPGFADWKDPAATGWTATTAGDYRLKTTSQAINGGSNSLYPADSGAIQALLPQDVTLSAEAKAAIDAALAKDVGGADRFKPAGGPIDIGAYEEPGGVAPATITLTINDEGTGAFSQNSFTIYRNPTGNQSGEQTVTLTGSEGYTNPKWLVDGVQVGTDNSVTLKAADYAVGGHSLTLMVDRNSQTWSKELDFTVAAD